VVARPGARLLGAVLAGGEGRRFGGPKAGVLVGGVPMVRRAVEAMAAVTDEVVVVSSVPVPEAGVPRLADRTPGKGPLGGLEAALREASARGREGVLLLACDLPLVRSSLLRAVAGALGGAPAVAPRREGGGVEPLCAAYALEVLGAVARRLSSADLSLHALFREVGGRLVDAELPEGSRDAFLNVNTPDDRRVAEARLREGEDARGRQKPAPGA
jgi:molybdopterin-guanine dinucleotide biosynthesis protein A